MLNTAGFEARNSSPSSSLTSLSHAAALANDFRKLSKQCGKDPIWEPLLRKLKAILPHERWNTEKLRLKSLVKPGAIEFQTEQFCRWIYSADTPGCVLFFPANEQKEFRGQGEIGWHPQNHSWLNLPRAATPIDPEASKTHFRPPIESPEGVGMMLSPVGGQVVPGKNGDSRRVAECRIPMSQWKTPLRVFEIDDIDRVDGILGHGGAMSLMAILPLSLQSLTDTGGRGNHGLGRETPWLAANANNLKWLLALLGFDHNTHSSTQITRAPGFRRPSKDLPGKLAYQTLIGLYRCDGALDPTSPFQEWPSFASTLIEWCDQLDLQGEVAKLSKEAAKMEPPRQLPAQLVSRQKLSALGKPERAANRGDEYKNYEDHCKCYTLAIKAIIDKGWICGTAMPQELAMEICSTTGVTPAELSRKFEKLDPFQCTPGALFGLGLVKEKRVYIGGLGPDGRYGIKSRCLPRRRKDQSLLAEWGHSISVFAKLGFSTKEEVAILHAVVDARKDGASSSDSLKIALRDACQLEGIDFGEWFAENSSGNARYHRAINLVLFHNYNLDLPDLADSLGMLLDRVESFLDKPACDIHAWIDLDCPRRRELFNELRIIDPVKVKKLSDLLKPNKAYTFQELVDLAVAEGGFGRVYRSKSRKASKPEQELTSVGQAVAQQVRRCLNELVQRCMISKTGKGGRGGHLWALTKKDGVVEKSKVGENGVVESLHTSVLEKGGRRKEEGSGKRRVAGMDCKSAIVSQHQHKPAIVPKSKPKKRNRRSFGLLGHLRHDPSGSGDVDTIVAFGVCRAHKDKQGKKQYKIRKRMLVGYGFDVAIVDAIPITSEPSEGAETFIVGHIIKGLLLVTAEQQAELELREKEILGNGCVAVKFFASNRSGFSGVSDVDHALLRVSCEFGCFNTKVGENWDRVAKGDLTITATALNDDKVKAIVDDQREKAADQALIAQRAIAARARRCLLC